MSSAWDLLTNQEVNIERLALAFPDHFGLFLENRAVANRLEIEGIVHGTISKILSTFTMYAFNWKFTLYA